jgi:phage shock protein E
MRFKMLVMKNIKWLIVLLAFMPLACASVENEGDLKRLGPDEFESTAKSDASAFILDVRTPGEFQRGHIAGASLLDFYNSSFSEGIKTLPKDKTIYIYCQSSNRSMQAVKMLQNAGIQKIVELKGGMGAWYAAGKNTVR